MGLHLKEAVINFVSKSFVPQRSRLFFHEFVDRQTFDNRTSSVSEIENRAYKHSAGGLRPGDALDKAHEKISILPDKDNTNQMLEKLPMNFSLSLPTMNGKS
jgi:hypothetical protein